MKIEHIAMYVNDLEKTKVIDMAIEEIYDDEDTKVFEIEENKD